MPKGCKKCERCGSINNGPRSYSCKDCGQAFAFKAQSKEKKNTKIIKDIDWRTLQKGDKIKVNSGPYYVSHGNFIPMGYRGKFIVDKVDDKGIHAWGIDKSAGFAYIYMGPDYQNKETGVWKIKHKILALRPHNKETVS